MAKAKPTPPQSDTPVTFADEYAGQGGSYIYDPDTGRRVLAHRTQDARDTADEPVAEAVSTAGTEPTQAQE